MISLPFTLLFWVWVYKPFLGFLYREDPLAFVGKLFWWCWILSAFAFLSMSCHSLLSWRVSIERPALILMGIPLCVICCFSHAAFNICSLCLIFINLFNMCLGVFCLGFIMFGTLWFSWAWVTISKLPHFREVFNYYLLKYCLMAFLFVFFFWYSYDSNVGVFNIVPEVSEVVLISFNFFLFSSLLHLFPPFYLPSHLSYLLPQLFYCWFPPECFDLSDCIIHYWLTLFYLFEVLVKLFLHLLNLCL